MDAFDADALFAKSRVFVQRGLRARDSDEFDVFHMWAALGLELLGKSALASVHPALVADPSKVESLLYACGRQVSDQVHSIGAKTIYERLLRLSKDFDQRMKDICVLMANRRNEELHSASSPTTDLDPRAWVPGFWRAAEVILGIRQKALSDWVGDEEAKSAKVVIADSSKVLQEAVRTRIARCKRDFDERYPAGSLDRRMLVEALQKAIFPLGELELRRNADGNERQPCPACSSPAWVFGSEFDRHRRPVEYDSGSYMWTQLVDKVYVTTDFKCGACGLMLSGAPELEITDLPSEFVVTEDVEPEFEQEYGND